MSISVTEILRQIPFMTQDERKLIQQELSKTERAVRVEGFYNSIRQGEVLAIRHGSTKLGASSFDACIVLGKLNGKVVVKTDYQIQHKWPEDLRRLTDSEKNYPESFRKWRITQERIYERRRDEDICLYCGTFNHVRDSTYHCKCGEMD